MHAADALPSPASESDAAVRRRLDSAATAGLIVAGLAVALAGVVCNHNRGHIGSPDQASYAHSAGQLLAGRGFEVAFIRHFFWRHPDIEHPEDQFGPGGAALIAVAWLVVGRSDWAATVPSLACGTLVLPLLTLCAARRCGSGTALAAVAGLTVLLAPSVIEHTRMALVDLPFATAVLAAWLMAARAGARATWSALAGALLGVGYYLKPAALLCLPGLALTVWMLTEGSRRHRALSVAVALAAFAALIAPWLVRNARIFGDPLYTVNKHVGALEDYVPEFPESYLRRVWWAHEGERPPTTGEVLGLYGPGRVAEVALWRLWRIVRPNRANVMRMLTAVVIASGLLALWRRKHCTALGLYFATQVLVMAPLFPVLPRYLFLGIPVAAAYAAVAGEALLQRERLVRCFRYARRSLGSWSGLAAGVLVAAGLLLVSARGMKLHSNDWRHYASTGGADRVRLADRLTQEAALWARDVLPPGARVMVADPWRFAYYSGLPTVGIPTDTPEAVGAVIDQYRVNHIVLVSGGAYEWFSPHIRAYLAAHGSLWGRCDDASAGLEVYRLLLEGPSPPNDTGGMGQPRTAPSSAPVSSEP